MKKKFFDANGKPYLSSGLVMKFTYDTTDVESEDTDAFFTGHSGEEVGVLDEDGKPTSELPTNIHYFQVEFLDGSRGYVHRDELSPITL